MDFVRIGDKTISVSRINKKIEEIIELRGKGYSQQEVAKILDVDRSFISRLESIGEVRKGGDIAVIGFPIKNKEEIAEVLKAFNVEYILLMNEEERQNFIKKQGGKELLESVLKIISDVRKYKHCIIIGSNVRTKILSKLLDSHVYTIEIGDSPLKNDIYVEPKKVLDIIKTIIE
ncbi:MAG: transcriptional regulator [Caloramator sp.]|jgi:transcriptional regulator with XRE-family HTH domain|uniref:transcriptional regulator n=1 Tax=Caloramator sp. TaxID=1871330 RepID=UPI001DF53C5C|nr:transcriptional regulator [Caloramator sp.]MBZ4664437.1 transcriptional regulator [Caloramator sp.]